jgi:hypothetical protein
MHTEFGCWYRYAQGMVHAMQKSVYERWLTIMHSYARELTCHFVTCTRRAWQQYECVQNGKSCQARSCVFGAPGVHVTCGWYPTHPPLYLIAHHATAHDVPVRPSSTHAYDMRMTPCTSAMECEATLAPWRVGELLERCHHVRVRSPVPRAAIRWHYCQHDVEDAAEAAALCDAKLCERR